MYRLFKYKKNIVIECNGTADFTHFSSFAIKKPNAVLALPHAKLYKYKSIILSINPKKVDNVIFLADKYILLIYM